MDVVRHDHPGVDLIISDFRAILDRGKDELCNLGLPQESGAAAGLIEYSVQRYKGLARG